MTQPATPAAAWGPAEGAAAEWAAEWVDIGPTRQISPGNARTLPVLGPDGQQQVEIAIFHTLANQFYALVNACPHKHGPLSQGIVHGAVVTCPLHSWNISLKTGEAMGDDKGCVPTIPIREDAGRLYLKRDALITARAPAGAPHAHKGATAQELPDA